MPTQPWLTTPGPIRAQGSVPVAVAARLAALGRQPADRDSCRDVTEQRHYRGGDLLPRIDDLQTRKVVLHRGDAARRRRAAGGRWWRRVMGGARPKPSLYT